MSSWLLPLFLEAAVAKFENAMANGFFVADKGQAPLGIDAALLARC
jgi:hypothetical protein